MRALKVKKVRPYGSVEEFKKKTSKQTKVIVGDHTKIFKSRKDAAKFIFVDQKRKGANRSLDTISVSIRKILNSDNPQGRLIFDTYSVEEAA